MEKEYRYISFDAVEVRADEDGEGERVEGYVNEFDRLSEDLGGFRERTERGVFSRSLDENDVVALWQHDQADPIGRMSNGLLDLEEDTRGLRFAIPGEAFSERQLEKIKDGTVKSMSFGFTTIEDRWEKKDGENVRTLVDVDLMEVSPVTFPAYPTTSAAVRSMEAWEAERAPEVTGDTDPETVARRRRAERRDDLARTESAA